MHETAGEQAATAYRVVRVTSDVDSFSDLRDALEAMRAEGSARVLVLDLREPGFSPRDNPRVLEHFVLPTVAAWSGELDEARLSAGLFCDIRVGEVGQRLTWAPSMPGAGRDRLARVLGVQDGDVMTALAHGMLESGLVSALAADDSLAEAERIAGVIASRGPLATQLAKEALWRGLALPMEHALRFETDLTLLLQTTNDRAEGVEAFLAKRPAQFTGT